MSRKKRGSGHNATGRSHATEASHVRLYHWFTDTAAWQDLSPAERAVYLEIERHFYGNNNGQIGCSARKAATACRISKDTATKAFGSLVAHGFIECVTPGGFSTNACEAPEWRVTRAPCNATGERATKAFLKWRLPKEVEAKRKALKEVRKAAAEKLNDRRTALRLLAEASPKGLPVLSDATPRTEGKRA